MSEVLYARVSSEVKAALDDMAEETGLSMSTITDLILKKALGLPTSLDNFNAALARLEVK